MAGLFDFSTPSPIQAPLNFSPGGNPFAGAAGGLSGMATEYGKSYNAALGQNQQLYNDILGGYQKLNTDVLGTIGQIGQAKQQDIADAYAAQAGQMRQSLINRGLGNTTVADTMQRGLGYDQQKAQIALADQIAQYRAGMQAQLGSAQLGFENSVTAKYPNADQYYNIFRDKGMMDQAAQDRALMKQLGARQLVGGGGAYNAGGAGFSNRSQDRAPEFGGGYGASPYGYGFIGGGGGAWTSADIAASQGGYNPVNIQLGPMNQPSEPPLAEQPPSQDFLDAQFPSQDKANYYSYGQPPAQGANPEFDAYSNGADFSEE